MSRPRGAMNWSAVCDCGISWSYSLTTLVLIYIYNLYVQAKKAPVSLSTLYWVFIAKMIDSLINNKI